MAEINSADIGFEEKIWQAACVLRGNMDASEYKHVVLGLIFLKGVCKYNIFKLMDQYSNSSHHEIGL